MPKPLHLDIKREEGLSVTWEGGQTSFYPVALLRKFSPSAEARMLREELDRNPLAVLPAHVLGDGRTLTIIDAELVGNYAIRLHFSDGHDTGIYTWQYLFEMDQRDAKGVLAVSVRQGHQVNALTSHPDHPEGQRR